MQPSTKQISNLLLVFGGGIIGALLIVYVMVTYYGPSSQYTTGDILIDPAIAKGVSFPDQDPQTGQMTRYVFDRIEYLAFDEMTNTWSREEVGFPLYRQIYDAIKNDKSVREVGEAVIDRFVRMTPATLTLVVKTVAQPVSTRVFQEIQIESQGDYYRITQHVDSPRPEWIYFYHPGIYKDIKELVRKK